MDFFDKYLTIKKEPKSKFEGPKDKIVKLDNCKTDISNVEFQTFLQNNPEIEKKSFIINKYNDHTTAVDINASLPRKRTKDNVLINENPKKIKINPDYYEESFKKFQTHKKMDTCTDYDFENMDFGEFTHNEAYSIYTPTKLKIGKPHPYMVVESRSLISAELPDIKYSLKMPSRIISKGLLSNVQLEAVVYACQKHEEKIYDGKRFGFLIGDGAGVGKGRSIAGIILENHYVGRKKAVWVSISGDLKHDAERDLNDIGKPVKINIPVASLSKMSYNSIDSKENGRFNEGVLFVTYSSLISYRKQKDNKQYQRRLDQIVDWLGEDFDGVIVFDECHKAKNVQLMNKTKTGLTVNVLQEKLKLARIVYASATGASEPKHMAYMVRLGLWGQGRRFSDFSEFENALTSLGVGAMELIAIEMKTKGVYLARQLSFQDVKFEIREIPIENSKINGHNFKEVYNRCVNVWNDIYHEFQNAFKRNRLSVKDDVSFEAQFWSAHQRFFKYLCIAGKLDTCVEIARTEVSEKNKCVVIGLQTTGEAQTMDLLEETNGDLFDFVSSAKGVVKNLIENHYPSMINLGKAKEKHKTKQSLKNIKTPRLYEPELIAIFGNDSKIQSIPFSHEHSSESLYDDSFWNVTDSNSQILNICEIIDTSLDDHIRQKMLKNIEDLDDLFPLNALDQLIDKLGGPNRVSEMTGRKGRMIHTNESVSFQTRKEQEIGLENVNLLEKDRFNRGDKLFAIISDAASTGISLHSDKRFINRRQRLHITLELPWSADKAIQQFGRTHRSNQLNSPHYIFLISDLAGERRFAATVAKRLESLGALTHGDRRCADNRDFGRFNFDNEVGLRSIIILIQAINSTEKPVVPFPKRFVEIFENDTKIFQKRASEAMSKLGLNTSKSINVTKFLNRLLGMEIDIQNGLFQYFLDIIDYEVNLAKSRNNFDHGIRDIMNENDHIYIEQTTIFNELSKNEDEVIKFHKIKNINSGVSWREILEKYKSHCENKFYVSGNFQHLLLALAEYRSPNEYLLITPNIPEKLIDKDSLELNWTNCKPEDIQKDWEYLHKESKDKCLHVICNINCPKIFCTYGKRSKINYMITGAVFSAFKIIGNLVSKCQISRIELHDGTKLIGPLVTPAFYKVVLTALQNAYQDHKSISHSIPILNNPDHMKDYQPSYCFNKQDTDKKQMDQSSKRNSKKEDKFVGNISIDRINEVVNREFKKPTKVNLTFNGVQSKSKPLIRTKKVKESFKSEMLPNVTVEFYSEFKKKK